VIFGILFLNGISRLDVHGFWEWPDNAVVPAVLARLEAERDPQHPTRIGYPPYLNACLVYERDRRSLDWLKVAPGGMSEEPAWDYMLVNRLNMEARRYGHYRVVEEFAALDVVLMRHEDGH